MRNLIRNVSQSSRCAPLSTVNFEMNPLIAPGATCSSAGAVPFNVSATMSISPLQHLRHKFARVERREVVDLFAGADESRWNFQFILDRDHDSAFAAAIEFSHDQTGKPEGLMKFARLTERITAGGCIDHEKNFMRRSRIGFGQGAFRFFEQNFRDFFTRDFDDVLDSKQRPGFALLKLGNNSCG